MGKQNIQTKEVYCEDHFTMKNDNNNPALTYWMELNYSLDTEPRSVSHFFFHEVTRNWVEHTLWTMIATAKEQGLKPHIASSWELRQQLKTTRQNLHGWFCSIQSNFCTRCLLTTCSQCNDVWKLTILNCWSWKKRLTTVDFLSKNWWLNKQEISEEFNQNLPSGNHWHMQCHLVFVHHWCKC